MANIEMIIDSIRVSQMNYQRVVILKEKKGVRYLPIWIGPAEADAIAVKMQNVSLSIPLTQTHDFTCAAIEASGGSVQSAIINELENDTFYAKVVLRVHDVGQKEIDCRPSDGLALAVRKHVPIYVDEEVLKKAGILQDEETGKWGPSSEGVPMGQRAGKEHIDILSESVEDILATSEAEAKRLNCGYVCTGHVLMALAKKMNTATKVMENAGVRVGRIQIDIQTLMKEKQAIEGGGVGLTSAVKEAIKIAIAEAKRLGSEKVLPEHVLLGLVRASDGIAANQLKDLGITPETVYVEIIRLYRPWTFLVPVT